MRRYLVSLSGVVVGGAIGWLCGVLAFLLLEYAATGLLLAAESNKDAVAVGFGTVGAVLVVAFALMPTNRRATRT